MKISFGAKIASQTDCNIFKTDDFYPPFSTRSSEQKANIDEKRFLEEVLLPLKEKREGPQKLKVFNAVWIQKEEDYFKTYTLPSDTEKILTLEG